METAKQLILGQLKPLGYPIKKELTRDFQTILEETYTKAIKTYFIAPKGIGEVVDGIARYNYKVSEVTQIEKQKDVMDFIGYSICQNQLIEYYRKEKEDRLYTFLYEYRLHDMSRTCVSLFIAAKEVKVDASIIQ